MSRGHNATAAAKGRARIRQLWEAGELPRPRRLSPIERARQNPNSLVWALKAWCWDDLLLDANKNCPDRAGLLADYYSFVKSIKGAKHREVVNGICHGCVGDSREDGDPGTWERRTDRCTATDCPLHPVRRRVYRQQKADSPSEMTSVDALKVATAPTHADVPGRSRAGTAIARTAS